MPWVRSEYAGETAVVSAWLAALVPWSVTYQPALPPLGATVYLARLGLFGVQIRPRQTILVRRPAELAGGGSGATVNESVPITDVIDLFVPGSKVIGNVYATTPPTAAAFYADLPITPETTAAGSSLFWGGVAWTVGAVVLLAALALSVALYRDETGVTERLPVDPVTAMGGLLGATCVAFAVGTVLFYLGRSVTGVPVPLGLVVVGALAVMLLRAERV